MHCLHGHGGMAVRGLSSQLTGVPSGKQLQNQNTRAKIETKGTNYRQTYNLTDKRDIFKRVM